MFPISHLHLRDISAKRQSKQIRLTDLLQHVPLMLGLVSNFSWIKNTSKLPFSKKCDGCSEKFATLKENQTPIHTLAWKVTRIYKTFTMVEYIHLIILFPRFPSQPDDSCFCQHQIEKRLLMKSTWYCEDQFTRHGRMESHALLFWP